MTSQLLPWSTAGALELVGAAAELVGALAAAVVDAGWVTVTVVGPASGVPVEHAATAIVAATISAAFARGVLNMSISFLAEHFQAAASLSTWRVSLSTT